MNEYHVYDEVPDHEAKGHRMETARWTEDFKPTADDPENVRCRLVHNPKEIGGKQHQPKKEGKHNILWVVGKVG